MPDAELRWLIGAAGAVRVPRLRALGLPLPGGVAVLQHVLDVLHGADGNPVVADFLLLRPPYAEKLLGVIKLLGAATLLLVFFVTVPMLFALHIWGTTGTLGAFALGAVLWYPLVFREVIPEAESRASFLAQLRSFATFIGVACKVRDAWRFLVRERMETCEACA